MRLSVVAAVTALVVAGCSNPSTKAEAPVVAAAPADTAAAEAEVKAFIERYNGFYGSNNLEAYFASFDPSLTQWWPSGRVDYETYKTNWSKGVAAGGGNSNAVVSDLRVQVSPSGDAAVASYLLAVTPRAKDGAPPPAAESIQETDVLFKRDGVWKVVHLAYQPVRPPRQR
jgi:ketosteroid isomerase-like protein